MADLSSTKIYGDLAVANSFRAKVGYIGDQTIATLTDLESSSGGVSSIVAIGWDFVIDGDPLQPTSITYSSGTEKLKIIYNWNSASQLTSTSYEKSDDSGSTWSVLGTETYGYNADGIIISSTWS
jgi:hypothetical protein